MDNGVQRRQWIKGRIEAIREELDELLRELGAPEADVEEAEQKRRKFTLYKGGLSVLVLLLSLGYFLTRYRRPLLTAAASVTAAAAVVAVVALDRSGPPGAAPAHGHSSQPTATASHSFPAPASAPASRRPTSLPHPRRTPLVPVVVPTRLRRTPSATPTQPVAFEPVPSPLPPPALPSSAPPSPVRSPSPGALVCPVGLRLVVLGSGLTVCV